MNHIETFVPEAGEAAGPPGTSIERTAESNYRENDWRAGGLAGLLQRYFTPHVQDQIVREVWISARINHELSIRRYG